MARQFLLYWRREQIDRAVSDGIGYIASNQLRKTTRDDVVWIVGTSERDRLITAGPVHVGRVCGKAAAARTLGVPPDSLWSAKHYVLPKGGAIKETTTVDLSTVTAELRFASTRMPRLDVREGRVNAQQLQTMRELTEESARKVLRVWNSRFARALARLPAAQLRRVTAEDLWWARGRLLRSRDFAPFDDSDDYDVLLEDGQRLPPKALFGKALSRTLEFEVEPKHFTGGASSTSFRILRSFGYDIVAKGESSASMEAPAADREWIEGSKKLRLHLRSERKSGLADAKREQFTNDHGKLYCERCDMDPIKVYGKKHGAACIEVHHSRVTVAAMQPGHETRLEDLMCLCANCHRVEHKRLRSLAAERRP